MHKNKSDIAGFQPSERWQAIRETITDRTLTFFIVLIGLGLPASLWRVTDTGWQPLYYVHIFFSVTGIGIYLLRQQVPFSIKLTFNVAATGLVGVFGLLSLGLVSNGFLLLLVMLFFIATTCTPKTVTIFTALTLLVVAAIGAGFSTGLLETHIDTNTLLAQPATWIVRWVTFGFTLLVSVYYITSLQKSTLELLGEVQIKHEEISHIANHDYLTGLPAMRLARDRFEILSQQVKRNNKKIALLFIDLDGFKLINDNHGHEAGDNVLQITGQRIQATIRQADTAARISGDEFLVILGDIDNSQSAAAIAEKLLLAIARPIEHTSNTLTISASIGIAIYPDNGSDLDTLKRKADEAMYSVKKTCKNHYAFFTQ